MKIAVTMRTNDRSPGPNYLRQTLNNALRAGIMTSSHLAAFDIVTSHPMTPALREEFHLALAKSVTTPQIRESKRVLTPNGCATEAHAVADSHDADYVLFIEDDLDFCSKFLESVVAWLQRYAEPQYPLYTFGSAAVSTVRSGAKPVRIGIFFGTQCYAIARRDHGGLVRWLVDNPTYNGKPRCHDLRLHHWADQLRATHFLASCPSFVQHVGSISGMGCTEVLFPSWCGRDWTYMNEEAAA